MADGEAAALRLSPQGEANLAWLFRSVGRSKVRGPFIEGGLVHVEIPRPGFEGKRIWAVGRDGDTAVARARAEIEAALAQASRERRGH